ncbi:MAG: hypothetical protein HY336_02610 [Candidatus Doudnabacteria bacterium]|nr:hypothetical protein [Candidatus Doudnabacteria bacterium]
MELNKKTVVFIILFMVLGLISMQIKLTHLAGSKASFTGFDAFAPVAGAFLGPIFGAISVLLMEAANFLIHGGQTHDAGTLIRFIPPIFATIYFARKTKWNFLIPLLAIVSFNLSPVGRSVWFFSLYWLIPVACYFWQDKSILVKSLGATFTAHAVGGAIWIHAFALPKIVWLGLIPVVAAERLLFTLGIVAAYLLMNNLVNILVKKKIIPEGLPINSKYLLHGKASF